MAFTVEDGSNVAGANSFASVADADAYFTDRNLDSDWFGLGTSEKESALVRATDYLNTTYRLQWKGDKTSGTQSLTFPRYDIIDEDGFCLASSPLPTPLLYATSEMGLALQDPATDPYAVDRDNTPVKSQSEKVDVIEVSVEYMTTQDLGGAALTGQSKLAFIEAKRWLNYLIISGVNGRVDRG